MGSKSRKYNMQEIDDTRSSGQMFTHHDFIENFLDKGYEIETQEMEEEEGLAHENISRTLTTVLRPASNALPLLKFVAKEIFGNYNYETQVFEARSNPAFHLKTFKKGSDIKSFNDPWDMIDLG